MSFVACLGVMRRRREWTRSLEQLWMVYSWKKSSGAGLNVPSMNQVGESANSSVFSSVVKTMIRLQSPGPLSYIMNDFPSVVT